MRPISGILILTLGMMGSIAVYWWMGLMLLFVGEALGVLTDRVLTGGLFAVGALAGGVAGLLAGSTALLGVRALAVRPPEKLPVFLGTWGAWMLLGALGSAFLRNALSPLAAASLLGVCHLIVCGLCLLTERLRPR
ncbi:uncharacterized protein STAUR_1995 [Stigmatella aurantiaca DW4/3-1]|uniref:Uncharacterized protein n=1 Tax=Stigmatella aurantiaca (strain DW4/3-1) TaxID=378806 RepID=E3FWT6_STIAD|nr:uncharacterized protein STAUR_1995 [Stigmatella aurantiaca DW4/3-1]